MTALKAGRPQPGRRGIAVLIADDHPVVRRGLKEILADTTDITVAGEVSSAREVLEHIRRNDCDCDVLCLDLTMPDTSGLDLLQAVRRERPRLPVLIISMHPEDQYAVRVLKAGAAGYVIKESAPDELVDAIRKVYGGGKYLSPRLAQAVLTDIVRPADRLPHERLSNREYQVLCLLAQGLSVKDIAHELHLSVKTISTFRARVLEKMQMTSTAQLIRYAIQNRLAD